MFFIELLVKGKKPDRDFFLRRSPVCCRNSLHDSTTQQQVKDALKIILAIPWEAEPTTHQFLLESSVRNVLEDSTPPGAPSLHKPWMSEFTVGIARSKASVVSVSKRLWFRLFGKLGPGFFVFGSLGRSLIKFLLASGG